MRLRRIAGLLGILVALQGVTWLLVGRHRLAQFVPQMARQDFSFVEAHERKYHFPVNPSMQLVVCDATRSQLGDAGLHELREQIRRFNVTPVHKSEANRLDPQLCYEPKWQTPFVAVAETWLGPQYPSLGGNGFDHYYLHVFGSWFHLHSRVAWVS